MIKPYKNFITSGCSFTAGVINNPNNSLVGWENKSSVWPHYCFLSMDPEQSNFINLAIPGGSNFSAFSNLVYYLETHKNLNSSNTLVGFNITGLYRYDEICDSNNSKANKDLCCIDPVGLIHPSQELGFAWITHGIYGRGQEKIEILNFLAILQGIVYLETNKFDYFFMLMNDHVYIDLPDWLKEFLKNRTDNWIKFENIMGMLEFVKQQNLIDDDYHPNRSGHKLIAEYVLKFLNNKINDLT